MPNPHLKEKIVGIRDALMAGYRTGGGMSSNSRGREREALVDGFLSKAFPPGFRFSHGDVTDRAGRRSGALDVVIEYPFFPSLFAIGAENTRLYLAEGVAAAIEVKSDVGHQWPEVIKTAEQLARLERDFGPSLTASSTGPAPPPLTRIPLYAVGFCGWKSEEIARQRLAATTLTGVLVIDSGVFVERLPGSTSEFCISDGEGHDTPVPATTYKSLTGPLALWGFITSLHNAISGLKYSGADLFDYLSAE
jgi:hypothetical protein